MITTLCGLEALKSTCLIKAQEEMLQFLTLMNLHDPVCFNCHRGAAVQLVLFPLKQAGTGFKRLGSLIKQCSQGLPSPLQPHTRPISENRIKESPEASLCNIPDSKCIAGRQLVTV